MNLPPLTSSSLPHLLPRLSNTSQIIRYLLLVLVLAETFGLAQLANDVLQGLESHTQDYTAGEEEVDACEELDLEDTGSAWFEPNVKPNRLRRSFGSQVAGTQTAPTLNGSLSLLSRPPPCTVS